MLFISNEQKAQDAIREKHINIVYILTPLNNNGEPVSFGNSKVCIRTDINISPHACYSNRMVCNNMIEDDDLRFTLNSHIFIMELKYIQAKRIELIKLKNDSKSNNVLILDINALKDDGSINTNSYAYALYSIATMLEPSIDCLEYPTDRYSYYRNLISKDIDIFVADSRYKNVDELKAILDENTNEKVLVTNLDIGTKTKGNFLIDYSVANSIPLICFKDNDDIKLMYIYLSFFEQQVYKQDDVILAYRQRKKEEYLAEKKARQEKYLAEKEAKEEKERLKEALHKARVESKLCILKDISNADFVIANVFFQNGIQHVEEQKMEMYKRKLTELEALANIYSEIDNASNGISEGAWEEWQLAIEDIKGINNNLKKLKRVNEIIVKEYKEELEEVEYPKKIFYQYAKDKSWTCENAISFTDSKECFSYISNLLTDITKGFWFIP